MNEKLLLNLLLCVILLYGVIRFILYWKRREIRKSLQAAERGLLALRSIAKDGGRSSRLIERSTWNNIFGSTPGFNIRIGGPPTVPEFLVNASEKDLQSSVYAQRVAALNAAILLELLDGSVKTAQSKYLTGRRVDGQRLNAIAGIYELIGVDEFQRLGEFTKDAGVNEFMLRSVARRRFPREITRSELIDLAQGR